MRTQDTYPIFMFTIMYNRFYHTRTTAYTRCNVFDAASLDAFGSEGKKP